MPPIAKASDGLHSSGSWKSVEGKVFIITGSSARDDSAEL